MARSEVLSGPSTHFEYKNRPYRDTFASVSLLVTAIAILAGGIFSCVHRDIHFFHKISDDYLSVPAHCPADVPGRNLLVSDEPEEDLPFDTPLFFKWLGPWILMSLVFAIVIGVLMVHLFRTNARRMISVAVGTMLGLWGAAALLFLLSGSLPMMGVALGMLALYGLAFYMWSDKFPLMAQLLAVTSSGLQQNASIALVPIVSPVVLTVLSLPVLCMSGAAFMNGKVVSDSDVQHMPDGTCQDVDGTLVNCCTWQPEAWVGPYVFFSMLFLSWVLFLGDQIKTYAIAGTVAQWYFSPVGTSTSGNLSRSVKHAFTSSFGSLCLSSAILAAVNYLRQLAENARSRHRGNIALLLVSCIAECFYSLVRFITKFATIRMAIKGDAFFSAAGSITGLLTRNFLNTVAVWWLPPFLLGMYTFTISLGWGFSVGLISYFQSGDVTNGVAMGAIAFFCCCMILSFITGLMLQIVDTVYICYAIEVDEHTCSKPDVHEVFNNIPRPKPTPGDVVENPDGNFAYAQPLESSEQQPLLAPTAPPATQITSQV